MNSPDAPSTRALARERQIKALAGSILIFGLDSPQVAKHVATIAREHGRTVADLIWQRAVERCQSPS